MKQRSPTQPSSYRRRSDIEECTPADSAHTVLRQCKTRCILPRLAEHAYWQRFPQAMYEKNINRKPCIDEQGGAGALALPAQGFRLFPEKRRVEATQEGAASAAPSGLLCPGFEDVRDVHPLLGHGGGKSLASAISLRHFSGSAPGRPRCASVCRRPRSDGRSWPAVPGTGGEAARSALLFGAAVGLLSVLPGQRMRQPCARPSCWADRGLKHAQPAACTVRGDSDAAACGCADATCMRSQIFEMCTWPPATDVAPRVHARAAQRA